MNADIKGYSQWFARKSNNVADALMRDWHLGDNKLTFTLLSHFPEQMPEFQNITVSQQDQLMADLLAAATSRE
jgi:hypothetical protein